jgi:hypothetical protein
VLNGECDKNILMPVTEKEHRHIAIKPNSRESSMN